MKRSFIRFVQLLCIGQIIVFADAFYLPGLAPVNFCPVEKEQPNCQVCELDLNLYLHFLF